MIYVAEAPWALLARKFHRLDSPSVPAVTLCGQPYRGWVWDATAVKNRLETPAEAQRPLKKKICRGCELRAARLARIAAGTALFPPARPVSPEAAQEKIRRRRARELAEMDQGSRERGRSVRSASAGLPTLGRQ